MNITESRDNPNKLFSLPHISLFLPSYIDLSIVRFLSLSLSLSLIVLKHFSRSHVLRII